MPGPLEGIRIIEHAILAFAPGCVRHLADMGADVIKIEQPSTGGDRFRGQLSVRHIPTAQFNYPFENAGRNKRSLALELKTEKGREILHKLIKSADVFITVYTSERLKRVGADYETLSSINPKLIYVSFSGWGHKGPDKDLPALDYIAFARSGIMGAMGEAGSPPPSVLPAMGDYVGAVVGAYATLLGLVHRTRTGEGQQIFVSLLASQILSMGGSLFEACAATGRDAPRISRKAPPNPLINTYQTKDGRWIQLCMPWDYYWPTLCDAAQLKDLEKNPKFDNGEHRLENSAELCSILDECFASKTLDEWTETFKGVDLLWSPVKSFGEEMNDPQVTANEIVMTYDHPVAGQARIPGFLANLSKTPGTIRRIAPQLGEHTEEILLQLGYTWDDINELKNEKIIL